MHRKSDFTILLLVLAGVFKTGTAIAVDGDVDYSAPYLWVDPETGEVSTVNPGPQPKVHTETAGSTRDKPAITAPPVEAKPGASPAPGKTVEVD